MSQIILTKIPDSEGDTELPVYVSFRDHAEDPDPTIVSVWHEADKNKRNILSTLTDEQIDALYYAISAATDSDKDLDADDGEDDEGSDEDEEE